VFVAAAASGCGAATRPSGHGPSGKFPVVVKHASVQMSGLTNVQLGHEGAAFLSPTRVAFMSSGTVSCAWLPTRITVLGPTAIRIDMRVNGDVASCGSGGVGFPIAVKIDPKLVDVHHALTVRLAYKVNLGAAGGLRQWTRTAVAPAIGQG
jgi:hypothetical protein